MNIWMILSWVLVVLMTAVNVFLFLKLKQASEQMMKLAFPGTKNMNEAMSKMQQMMQSFGGLSNGKKGAQGEDQLKAAMNLLQQMQQKGPRR